MSTSLRFGETLMEIKYDFVHKVLDVTALWATHKHCPVMCEAIFCGSLSQNGRVAKLNLDLNKLQENGGKFERLLVMGRECFMRSMDNVKAGRLNTSEQ